MFRILKNTFSFLLMHYVAKFVMLPMPIQLNVNKKALYLLSLATRRALHSICLFQGSTVNLCGATDPSTHQSTSSPLSFSDTFAGPSS